MRKWIIIIAGLALALTLSACGSEPKENEANAATKPEATATVAPANDTDGDGINDADDPDPYVSGEEDDAPTDDEEDFEDYFEEPETEQTARTLNQWGKDEGMKARVTSMEEVGSIAPTDPEWYDGVSDKPGSKLIEVHVDIKNEGKVALDPLCGGGYGFTLLDENDRNFEPLDKLLDINNNVCDDGISPGFKSSYKLAYRIPNGSEIGGLVVWNSESEDDFDGTLSNIIFMPIEADKS